MARQGLACRYLKKRDNDNSKAEKHVILNVREQWVNTAGANDILLEMYTWHFVGSRFLAPKCRGPSHSGERSSTDSIYSAQRKSRGDYGLGVQFLNCNKAMLLLQALVNGETHNKKITISAGEREAILHRFSWPCWCIYQSLSTSLNCVCALLSESTHPGEN